MGFDTKHSRPQAPLLGAMGATQSYSAEIVRTDDEIVVRTDVLATTTISLWKPVIAAPRPRQDADNLFLS